MAAAAAPAPAVAPRASSPTQSRVSTFGPLPSFPSAQDLKPNPHPYAIKTTSTALLSRSNSSSSHRSSYIRGGGKDVNDTQRHNYVPQTPTKSSSNGNSGSGGRKGEYRGHRYSRSLSSDTPISFPQPGPAPAISLPQEPPLRLRRAETLPPSATAPMSMSSNAAISPMMPTDPLAEELPPNPKAWTPSHLAVYLITALRVTGRGDLPAPVAKDIASFIKSKRITGRVFLRFNEDDLEGMGMNKLWRQALLSASRTLRQNVVRGRIWGFEAGTGDLGSPLSSSDDDVNVTTPLTPSDDLIKSEGDLPSKLRLVDDYDEDDADMTPSRRQSRRSTNKLRRANAGRVKGMVESFERTRSGSESDASSISASESEGGEGDEAEKIRKRKRKMLPVILSPSSPTKSEGGVVASPGVSVPPSLSSFFVPPSPTRHDSASPDADERPNMRKGLSAFFASASQEPQIAALPGTPLPMDEHLGPPRLFDSPPPSSELPSIPDDDVDGTVRFDAQAVKEQAHISTSPASVDANGVTAATEEPTIEELLRQHVPSSPPPSLPAYSRSKSGARAWEEDAIGETVKRVPVSPSPPASALSPRPPSSPPKKKSPFKTPAKAYSQKSLSRVTGARAWEAEIEFDVTDAMDEEIRGYGSERRGNRKVTVKRVADVFGLPPTSGGENPNSIPETTVESVEEEKADDLDVPTLLRKDSGVQVDEERELEKAVVRDDGRIQAEEVEREREKEEFERRLMVEHQLEESIAHTRVMAEAIKARLEDVERKVEDLEEVEKRREREKLKLKEETERKEKEKERAVLPSPPSPLTSNTGTSTNNSVSSTLNSKVLTLLQRYVGPLSPSSSSSSGGDITPTTIRGLPSYVLLVGIGVCAVVLKVLVRRALGGRGRGGT